MPSLASLLGLEQPSEHAVQLVRKMAFLRVIITATFEVSTTWFIIFVATALGRGDYFVGLTSLGVLIVIRSGLQTVIDYPSGTLGDRFGQRYVLAIGLLCYSAAYWLISTLTFETSFIVFIILYILLAVGASQMSGAVESWFDNNYRFAMPEDTERKSYGALMGRIGMLTAIAAIAVIIPGAWLATLTARELVFQTQSVLCILLAIIVIVIMKDFVEITESKEREPSPKSFTTILMEGLRFLRSDPFIILTTFGEVLCFAVMFTFWFLTYYPLLFFFLLTDVAVSSYRTLLIISAAVETERSGIWSKRFDPVKWIPRFRFIWAVVRYGLFGVIVFLFPAPSSPDTFIRILIPFTNLAIIEIPFTSLIPGILILLIFSFSGLCNAFGGILTQRIYLDIIPDDIRNSWYSLQPTLRTLLMMPLVVFFGWFIPAFGLSLTFFMFAIIGCLGVLLLRQGFKYPIPASVSTEKEIPQTDSIPGDIDSSEPVEFDDEF